MAATDTVLATQAQTPTSGVDSTLVDANDPVVPSGSNQQVVPQSFLASLKVPQPTARDNLADSSEPGSSLDPSDTVGDSENGTNTLAAVPPEDKTKIGATIALASTFTGSTSGTSSYGENTVGTATSGQLLLANAGNPTKSQLQLIYRGDVGVRGAGGAYIGQVRLKYDPITRKTWAYGKDGSASAPRYDVTGKTREQISWGTYGKLELLPPPSTGQSTSQRDNKFPSSEQIFRVAVQNVNEGASKVRGIVPVLTGGIVDIGSGGVLAPINPAPLAKVVESAESRILPRYGLSIIWQIFNSDQYYGNDALIQDLNNAIKDGSSNRYDLRSALNELKSGLGDKLEQLRATHQADEAGRTKVDAAEEKLRSALDAFNKNPSSPAARKNLNEALYVAKEAVKQHAAYLAKTPSKSANLNAYIDQASARLKETNTDGTPVRHREYEKDIGGKSPLVVMRLYKIYTIQDGKNKKVVGYEAEGPISTLSSHHPVGNQKRFVVTDAQGNPVKTLAEAEVLVRTALNKLGSSPGDPTLNVAKSFVTSEDVNAAIDRFRAGKASFGELEDLKKRGEVVLKQGVLDQQSAASLRSALQRINDQGRELGDDTGWDVVNLMKGKINAAEEGKLGYKELQSAIALAEKTRTKHSGHWAQGADANLSQLLDAARTKTLPLISKRDVRLVDELEKARDRYISDKTPSNLAAFQERRNTLNDWFNGEKYKPNNGAIIRDELRTANFWLAKAGSTNLEQQLVSATEAYKKDDSAANRKLLNETLSSLRQAREKTGIHGDNNPMSKAAELLKSTPQIGAARYKDIDPDGAGPLRATYVGAPNNSGGTIQTRVRVKETYQGHGQWTTTYQAYGVLSQSADKKSYSEFPGRVYDLKTDASGRPITNAADAIKRARELLKEGAISVNILPPKEAEEYHNRRMSIPNDGRFESDKVTLPAGIKGLGNPYLAELRSLLDQQVAPNASRYLATGNNLIKLRGSDLTNYVGVAMNLAPNVIPVQGGGPQVLFAGEQLKAISPVVEAVRKAGGGEAPQIRAVPVYLRVEDNKFAVVTIFRVRGNDGRELIVDRDRVYGSLNEWKQQNKLPAVDVYLPKDAVFQSSGGKVVFEAFNNRRLDNVALPVVRGGVALLGAAAGVAAILGTGGLAAPIIMAGASAFSALDGGWTLIDRNNHGQTLSLSNEEARGAWFDIAGGVLGLGAIGTSNRIIGTASDIADALTLLDGGQQYLRDFSKMSAADRVISGSQLLFWGTMLGVGVKKGQAQFDLDTLSTRVNEIANNGQVSTGKQGSDPTQSSELTRQVALDRLEHQTFYGSRIPDAVRDQFLKSAEHWAQQQVQTRGGTVAGHLEALALNGSATRADLLRPLVAAQMGGNNKALEQAVQAQLKGMNEAQLKNLLVKRDGEPQQAYVDVIKKALAARWSEDFGLNSAQQSRLQQGIDARLQGKSREQQRVELVNLANSDALRRSLVNAATGGQSNQPIRTGNNQTATPTNVSEGNEAGTLPNTSGSTATNVQLQQLTSQIADPEIKSRVEAEVSRLHGQGTELTPELINQITRQQTQAVLADRRQKASESIFNDEQYRASLREKLRQVAGDDPARLSKLVNDPVQLNGLAQQVALDRLSHQIFSGSGVPDGVRQQFLTSANNWAQQQFNARGGTVAGHLEALALNESATRADLLRPLVAAQMGGGNKPLEQAVQAQLKGMNEGELKNLLVKHDGQPQQAYVDVMKKALVARWSEDFGLNSAQQSRLQQGIDARLTGKNREQQRVELVNLANSDVLRRSLVTAATEGRVTQPVETGKKTPNNDGVDSQTPPSDVALNPQSSDPSDPLSVTYSVGGQSITLRRVLSDYVAWKEGPGRSPSAYSGNPPWFVSVGQKAEAAVGFDNLKQALNTERPNTTAQFDILNALGVPPSLIPATSSVDPNDDVPAVTTNTKPTSNTSNNASGLDAQGQRAQQLFIEALNKNPQLTNPDGLVDKASAADAAARFLSDYNDLQLQYNGAVELTTTIFAHKTQQGVRYFVAFPAVGSQFTVPSSVDNRVVSQLPPGAVVVAQLHNHPLNTSVAPIAGPSLDDVGTLIQRAGSNLRTLEGDYIVQTVTTPDGTTPILMQVELKPQFWLVEDKAKLGRLISSGQADPNDYVRVRYIPMAGQPTASPVPLNVVTYDDNKQLRTVLRPENVIGAQADITAPMFPNATSKQTSQQSIDLQPLLGQNVQTPALDKVTGLVGGVLSKDVVVRRPVDTSFRRSEIFEKVPERSDYASDADFARDVGNWYRGLDNLLTQQLKNRGDIDLNISYSNGSTTSLRTLRDQLRAEYSRLKPTLDAAINSGTTSGTDWTAHNQANATRQVRALVPEALTQTGLNPRGKTAIDLESGAGVETQKLLDLGFGKVIAVDGDQGSMSQLLGRIGSQSRLETQVTTFENAKFGPQSVDFVWSGLSLSHVPPAKFESAWNNVDTAIKPGGVFAGDFFAATSNTSHPDPNRSYFTEAQLRELFDKSGYNIVSLQRTSSLRFENGSDFRGQIPLWEVVAVKRGAESQPTVQTGNTNSSTSDKPNLTDADPTDSSDKTTPQTNDASSSSWRSYYEATFGRPPEGTLVRFMNNRIRGGENLPDRSLVLGSGDGAETAYLISQGQDVVAVDLDPASAEFVQRSIELRRQDSRFNPENFGNVTTVQGSFQDFRLPSAGSVDLVWSASLPFVSRNELPAVLKRVEQTLSPDGHVVATFFGPNHPLASQSDKTIYSEAELRALFSKDYDVVSINRISPNGRLADGTQVKLDLFEVVARKRSAPNVGSSSTTYSNQIPPTDTSRTDSIAEPDPPSSVNNTEPVDKNTASENGDTPPSADITSNTPAQIADTAEFLSQLEGTSTLDDIRALMDRAPATVLRDPQVTQSLLRKLNDTGEVVFRVDSRSPSEIVADGGFKLAPGHDFIYAATDLYSGGGHNHPNGGFYVVRKPPVTETFGPTVFDFEAEANRRYQEYQSTGNTANLSTNPYFNVSQLTPQQQQNLRLHAGNQFQIRYARDIPLNEIVLAGQLGADGHTLQYLAPVDRIQNGRPVDPGKGVTNNTQGDSASTSYEELQSLFNRPIDAEKMQELSGRWANIDTQWQQLQEQIEEIRSNPSDPRNAALNRAENQINDLQMSGSGTLTPGLMSNATIADAQRARTNWQTVNRQIAMWAERGEPLTLDRIKDLNRQLGQGLTPFNDLGLARESNARFGELRGSGQDIEDGMVTGQDYLPGEDVDRAMRDFVAWYQANEAVLPPQQLAAQAYQRLVSIHPFQDGNGRTALAVTNWILMAKGAAPIAVDPNRDGGVLALFPSFDRNLPSGHSEELITSAQENALRIYRQALQIDAGKGVTNNSDGNSNRNRVLPPLLPENSQKLYGRIRDWPGYTGPMPSELAQETYSTYLYQTTRRIAGQIIDAQSSGQPVPSLYDLWVDARSWRVQIAQTQSEIDNVSYGEGFLRELNMLRTAGGTPTTTPLFSSTDSRYAAWTPRVRDLFPQSVPLTQVNPNAPSELDFVRLHHGTVVGTTDDGTAIPLTTFTYPDTGSANVPLPDWYGALVRRNVPDFELQSNPQLTEIGTLERAGAARILHTDPKYFPQIQKQVEALYQHAIDPSISDADFVRTASRLYWWLAHAMPDARGSAAKADFVLRTLYQVRGINLPAWRPGVVPDMEALTRTEADFVNVFPTLLEANGSGAQ
jgi:Fic family protein/SAM-dependent methyltransferase